MHSWRELYVNLGRLLVRKHPSHESLVPELFLFGLAGGVLCDSQLSLCPKAIGLQPIANGTVIVILIFVNNVILNLIK